LTGPDRSAGWGRSIVTALVIGLGLVLVLIQFSFGLSGPLAVLVIVVSMAVWVLPSVLIARYAEHKGHSYVLFLLIGLFVSFFVSAVLTFMVEDRSARPQAPPDRLDRLKNLSELRDSGALSDDEFESEKARIIAWD
jgi:drug/metabolite transporter (DMT)-like permease